MTRRKAPKVEFNDAFELVGDDFGVLQQELVCLTGLDALACQLYFMCLRPFADPKTGHVRFASLSRFAKRLTPASSPRGGPRKKGPTRDELQGALTSLFKAGAIKLFSDLARQRRVLQIEVVRRFGVVSSDSVGREVRRKAGSSQTRANARLRAELHTGSARG